MWNPEACACHENVLDAPERSLLKGCFAGFTHAHDSITTRSLFSEKNRLLWDINSPARCGKAYGSLPGLGPRALQLLKQQPTFTSLSAGLPGAEEG